MSGRIKPQAVLDLDFAFLDDLPVEDWFPALLSISQRERATWYDVARVIDRTDNPSFLEALRKEALERPQSGGFPVAVPTDPALFKEWIWESFLPDYIRTDRRRISSYRVALRTLREYAQELDQAGFDPASDGAFTKLLLLPRALKCHAPASTVFDAMVRLDTPPFATFAKGGNLPAPPFNPLKEYLDALNRRYH